MEPDEMSLDLRLAAIIALLSSSVLRGVTANKTAALLSHLEAAVFAADMPGPYLKDTVAQTLAGWQKVHCHPASISFDASPLTMPGQALH